MDKKSEKKGKDWNELSKEMFKKRKDLSDPHEIKALEEEMVLNSLTVLFKRGIKGTYLYAHDPLLRKTLVSMFKQATQKTK